MKIAIVGGGINGMSCAWTLAKEGHQVSLFERNHIMQQTSSASSKLLHGGLRYLENGEFRLVYEALKERDNWFKLAPHLAKPIKLSIPVYNWNYRSRWEYFAGLTIYKILAFNSCYSSYHWLSPGEMTALDKGLKNKNLIGGYQFYDGQMDDYKLGIWVAEQARRLGADLYENTDVIRINTNGLLTTSFNSQKYEYIVNTAGPWAEKLCQGINNKIPYCLDLVRGSHIVVNKKCVQPYLLEAPNEKRIFFVLPWHEKTLVGTTEVRQKIDDKIECSEDEKNYLLKSYNYYLNPPLTKNDIIREYSGLRPLIRSSKNLNETSREYKILKNDRVITVLGGKWTTALSLSRKVLKRIYE